MPPTRTRPPQLLIASHNHGAGSELLQLAERRGYAVRRAHSGAQALEQAHAAPPDLVVLDESLTDMDAFAATRALRDDDHVGPGTPLLLISAQRPSSPQHHAALRAGGWEFLRHPFNAEEVAAKLDTYVLLTLDSDRARHRPRGRRAPGRAARPRGQDVGRSNTGPARRLRCGRQRALHTDRAEEPAVARHHRAPRRQGTGRAELDSGVRPHPLTPSPRSWASPPDPLSTSWRGGRIALEYSDQSSFGDL